MLIEIEGLITRLHLDALQVLVIFIESLSFLLMSLLLLFLILLLVLVLLLSY